MRQQRRSDSRILILRPHPWAYRPVRDDEGSGGAGRAETRRGEADRFPPLRTVRRARLTGCPLRLARWLGLG